VAQRLCEPANGRWFLPSLSTNPAQRHVQEHLPQIFVPINPPFLNDAEVQFTGFLRRCRGIVAFFFNLIRQLGGIAPHRAPPCIGGNLKL
jgi:hypothetical protein